MTTEPTNSKARRDLEAEPVTISRADLYDLEDEIERLRAVIAVAAAVCGRNNCNCPGAPRVKAALEGRPE